ncbi:MAG: hypothetical protein AAF376_12235 [Pseudomonadota bacterium]
MKRSTLSALLLLIASPLMAHPGHGEAATATHWVSDLSHLAVLGLLAALVAIVGGVMLHRRIGRKSE